MNAKKQLSIMLLTAVVTSITSCQNEPVTTVNETTDTEVINEITETETSNTVDDLPDEDFEGRAFRVLAAESTAYKGYICVEEETGDVLNDAIYNANRAVEERFNFVIEQEIQEATAANNLGTNLIMAGDDVYDIISLTDRLALSYAVQGMLVSYDEMPYIDLDKEYWCRSINDSMTIGGNHWLAYSDFNLSVYDYTFVLAFNKQLLDELQLENPYELVESGKWTYDAFNEMCIAAVRDLDGDSVMTENDRYGWSGDGRQILPTMWVAAGVTPVTKDENDLPIYTLASDEAFAEVYERIFNLAWNNNAWYPVTNNININTDNMFRDGNALFQTTSFGLLDSEYYRDMNINYGIIPHPKFNEAQSEYYTRVEGGRIFAIPVTNTDLDFTGIALEAMSYQASVDIIPAYFEIALKTKYTRDDESAKMFDLVMETRVYDLADTFWCEQIRDGFLGQLFKSGSEALASAAESNRTKVEDKINETIEALAK